MGESLFTSLSESCAEFCAHKAGGEKPAVKVIASSNPKKEEGAVLIIVNSTLT
jgi:hypothetical protein